MMPQQPLFNLLAGMLADPSILTDQIIKGMSLDSREIKQGDLFFSLAKTTEQREAYLTQALAQGAEIVLYENNTALTTQEVALLKQANALAYPVGKLEDKVAEIAARFYGHPSLALTVIAVTGTNGKTSVSQFIAQSLEVLSLPCAVIGTLGVGRLNELTATGMTTPDPVSVQRMLFYFCQQGIKYAVIEASSHALDQGRLNSVVIDVAILTNLTRDHLDYHQSMAAYQQAKAHLFDFASIKTAIVNQADEFGLSLIDSLSKKNKLKVLSYNSQQASAQTSIQAKNVTLTMQGLQFNLVTEKDEAVINSPLLGRFNVDNLLAAIACLTSLNIEFEQVIEAIQQCHAVDGRMEMISKPNHSLVVIDFAHTPDALKQALSSLTEHVSTEGELWCVFGCGGDRDTGKRALMGEIAEQLATQVVITNDNPRTESPELIVNNILSGIKIPENVTIIEDRKLAITYALSQSKAEDIILIAGKGHEQYQDISNVKTPFSDHAVVHDYFNAANDASLLTTGETA